MLRGAFMTFLGLCALAGVAALFGAFQLQQMQAAAQPEPRDITLAELIQNGAGDNAHLRLSQFSFGKPVMEKSADGPVAWVPLYPAATRGRPAAFWRVRADEASLPELLKATTLEVIDAGRMPAKTLWTAKAPARVLDEYPAPKGQPAAKVLVLAEAPTQLLRWTIEPGQLFDPNIRIAAWTLGGVLTLFGLGGLLWLGKSEARSADAVSPVDSMTLAGERAVSSHQFNTAEYVQRSFWLYLYLGGLGAFCALLFVAGVSLLRRSPDAAYVVMGFSSLFLVISYWLFHIHNQYRTQGVARIDVCTTGIRWLKSADGEPRTASWSQIAGIDANHQSPYPWRHFLVLTLHTGEVLRLAGFSLTDYHAFAKNLSDGFRQRAANVAPPPTSGYQKLTTAVK